MPDEEVSDDVFKSAVFIVQNMPKDGEVTISNSEKLEFYGLFKQATLGPCNISKPGIWNVVERYKWDAWNSLGKLDSKKAKQEYVIRLRNAMDKVFEKHNTDEMMADERWGKIRSLVEPHFENIGRPLTTKNIPVEHDKTPQHLTLSEQQILSDDEYTDANDSPVLVEPANSIISNSSTPNDPITNGFKTEVVSYMQTTSQVVLHQIQILSNTLQKQNAIIHKFIDYMKSKQSSPISWPFLFLLLVWPIIVQLAIRYFFKQN